MRLWLRIVKRLSRKQILQAIRALVEGYWKLGERIKRTKTLKRRQKAT